MVRVVIIVGVLALGNQVPNGFCIGYYTRPVNERFEAAVAVNLVEGGTLFVIETKCRG